jgi:hypothetical protein
VGVFGYSDKYETLIKNCITAENYSGLSEKYSSQQRM